MKHNIISRVCSPDFLRTQAGSYTVGYQGRHFCCVTALYHFFPSIKEQIKVGNHKEIVFHVSTRRHGAGWKKLRTERSYYCCYVKELETYHATYHAFSGMVGEILPSNTTQDLYYKVELQ